MSSTTHAVRNAATALKKAADPWNKDGRETADRIVSAAMSVIDTPSLDQSILDTLSGLLRHPFAELYLTYPGTALRLSAAVFTSIIYDKIFQSWKSIDPRRRSNWEQLAVILLAGVQDHVEAHSNERVKIVVAQAYYAIICNAFSVSSTIPLSTYSVSLRVSAYSLLTMTADGCVENKNKLRDNKILGGVKLGRVITMTKDYLALEQLLILLAYLLPPTEGRTDGRAERHRFLRDCFVDSNQCGKDIIELLKYVASPDWELTSDKIVDILARDISVAQPFVMKSFTLDGSPNPRLNPANRFYLDRTSVLFNCEDEDGKIEGIHVPYDNIRGVALSSSGTIVAQLSSPPQCHESLQVVSNDSAVTMTVMISPKDIEHFVRTLRVRGMTSRIKLNGMPIQRATERTSVTARLEFEYSGNASYQNKSKFKASVLQESDPLDDNVSGLEVCVNELQDGPPLLAKECPSPPDLPSAAAPAATHGTKVGHNGGRNHVSSAACHQLSSVHEDSQKYPTTLSLAPGPPLSPHSVDPSPLHSPRAFGPSDSRHNGDHVAPAYSSPSGHSHYGHPSDKDLSDAIFGASDEELSSLSDTDSIFCAVQPSAEFVQPRRIIRGQGGSKHHFRSQRHRHPHLSARPTSPTPIPAPDPSPAKNTAPEQKLAPMVKGLRVMDSQDISHDKLLNNRGAGAATKRKKIVIGSEEEIEATSCIPPVVKKSSPMSTSNLVTEKKAPRRKAHQTAGDRTAAPERPKRACALTSTARADIKPKARPSAVVGQFDSNKVKAEKETEGGNDGGNNPNDWSQKSTSGERVAVEQETVQTAKVTCEHPVTEGDMQVASPKHGLPRKRARLEQEDISSPRNKPSRSKKDISASKPRKAAPSRVRKTYRKRQKVEQSSPGRCVNRDMDYDEIPPSTVALHSFTTKECTWPSTKTSDLMPTARTLQKKRTNGRTALPGAPTVGPGRADEIPNSTLRESACRISGPPTEVVVDDDPIRSFSSSPSESFSLAADTVNTTTRSHFQLTQPGPPVTAPCEAGVRSGCLRLSAAVSPAKSPDMACISATTRRVITETESNIASIPAACGAISHRSTSEDVNASAESRSNSFLVATEDTAQGGSKALADLDYLDGPTIIAEPSGPYKTGDTCATPGPAVEVIDLTGDTHSSTCLEKITSPHEVSTSSPALLKGRASEDITDSSVLDLTDTKYRDFEVSLDSSFCLPSTNSLGIKRIPTPPPPRMKRKSVTFAAPLEEVVEERPRTQEAPAEDLPPAIKNESNKLEYLEVSPDLARGNGSSSFHFSGGLLTIERQTTPPLSHPASRLSMTTQPLSSLSSSFAQCQNRSYLTEGHLPTAAYTKQKHRARDALSSPSTKTESTVRGSYLTPIMTVLDEIHSIIKSNVQTRFERLNSRAVELRRQILAQIQADMTALLDEYATAFNDLAKLEAKYGAFSRRRIAAFTQVRSADAQSLASLRAQIQIHDRAMQVHARHTFVVDPLPGTVRRWM